MIAILAIICCVLAGVLMWICNRHGCCVKIGMLRVCNINPYMTIELSYLYHLDESTCILIFRGMRSNSLFLLAHLSRRLIGELIVYEGIRRPHVVRPSVRRPSVRQHFQTTSPLKP